MDSLKLKAYAKVNLGLDVLRRREDGYHEVKMVMQTVGICDEIEMTKLPEDVIRISADKPDIPTDGRNLIYKAVKLVKQQRGIRQGVAVSLIKRIPVAAGMAGGSADCATAIKGMNLLFGLEMSLKEQQELGVRIGADVPYCLMGGTALSEGIGERLTKLPCVPRAWLVIAKPDINVSTKFVYENLGADRLTHHSDIDGMVEGIRNGDIRRIAERMENVLETVTARRYPVIDEIKKFLTANGAANAIMSGSGPTVFGIFLDRETAGKAYEAMKEKGYTEQLFLTGFVPET